MGDLPRDLQHRADRWPRWLGDENARPLVAACLAVIAVLTVVRGIFAAVVPLRVDEAYYWTWSKESALSFLDHPPMVSWCVYFGTLIFGDTNFGVRFSGLLAILTVEVLLADIVWLMTRDWRCVIFALLLPEATLDYGLLMARVAPDTALTVFALAIVWALVRLTLSGNPRWWLLAGVFAGLALLSKYSVVLLAPAFVAFLLVPSRRKRQLSSPYPWLAVLIAIVIFSPVLYWNAIHDWASFRFQLDRPAQLQGWSLKFLGEFVGMQFGLLGPVLFPMILVGTAMFGWRGFRSRDPVAILLSLCAAVPIGFLLCRSLYARIGDSWPLFAWPFAFACAAVNVKHWQQEAPNSYPVRTGPLLAGATILFGTGFVVLTTIYYTALHANYLGKNDPIGKEAGFARLVEAAHHELGQTGASWFATTDYRTYAMLRWHLRDHVPVVQINERDRYLGFGAGEAEFAGPVGLYVAAKDTIPQDLWQTTSAVLEPAGQFDLTWRGARYDSYAMFKLTNWHPRLSPPTGDPLRKAVPH
jgi:4-amino-4-deoxy-L-arabinose transferase-like glycosyltransferase